MSVQRRVLVLGGIRSGKSELAESLVGAHDRVRYVATARGHDADPDWAARVRAHRDRRPAGWRTEEIGEQPGRLAEVLAAVQPDEAVLVDDLGGWLTALLDDAGAWPEGDVDAPAPAVAVLTAALRARPGTTVLV